MRTLSIDYNGIEGLLGALTTLSNSSHDVVDTWEVVKVKDCTTCSNVIKYERNICGHITTILPGGCKAAINFNLQENIPITGCEFYSKS